MNEERISLAHFIKKRREDLGISQKEVAEALSYSPQAISRLESIGTSFPLEILDNLCRILDISLDDLFLRNLDNPQYQPIDVPVSLIPAILKQVRESHHLTQAALASELGLTYRSIHNYESGEALPTWKVIESICLRFDYRPSYLLSSAFLAPARKKYNRKFVGLASSFGSFLLAALIVVPLTIHFLAPRQPSGVSTSSDQSTLSDFSSSSEDSASVYVPAPLPTDGSIQHPVLTVFGEKNEFSYIGETLQLQVVGLTKDIVVSSYSTSDRYVQIYSESPVRYKLDLSYGGSFRVTLLEALPGTLLTININDPVYGSFVGVSYLYYGGDQPVTLKTATSKTYTVSNFSLVVENGASLIQISEDYHEFIHFRWDIRDEGGNQLRISPLDLDSSGVVFLTMENHPERIAHREWFYSEIVDLRTADYQISTAFSSDGICHRFALSSFFDVTLGDQTYQYSSRPVIVEIV